MSHYEKHNLSRVHQGDIYKNIICPRVHYDELRKEPILIVEKFPYIVVISQECDLQQDYTNRELNRTLQTENYHGGYIPSILLSPAFLSDTFRSGEHLSSGEKNKKSWKIERINSSRWKIIKKNNNFRYHFLAGDLNIQMNDLVVDFKYYYTISREYFYNNFLKRKYYVSSLKPIYREHLSYRFFHYLGRIGLP